MRLLTLALVLFQQKIIYRTDPQKDLYQKSVEACEQALKLLDSDPESALQKLSEVHERLESSEHKGLEHFEKILRFEILAGDYSKPVAFYPFQTRGRVRLRLAELAKNGEDRRRLLAEAAEDLRKSVDRGVKASEEFLQRARDEISKLPPPPPPAATPEELAALWSKEWAELRPKLAFPDFRPAEVSRGDALGKMLRRMPQEASPRDQVEASQWVTLEAAALGKLVRSLPRDEARRAVAWCEILGAATAGIDALAAARESIARTRSEAARIAEYRGSFTLKIGPAPYAEHVRVWREGTEIPVGEAATPVVLSGLEIGDFTVVLSHPDSGVQTIEIRAASLKEGGSYVLSGRMKGGALAVTPLP